MDIRVGEWFPGALHKGQRLKVTGQQGQQNELSVETITDLDTKATFSRHHVRLDPAQVPIQGTAWDVVDLTFKGGQDTPDIAGYAFDVRTNDNVRHSVIMRGRKCEGPPLADAREVRLTGRKDTGGVIHTQELELMPSSGRIVVTPSRPRWQVFTLLTLLVAVFVAVPWAFAVPTNPAPEVYGILIFWTGFLVIAEAVAGVADLASCATARNGVAPYWPCRSVDRRPIKPLESKEAEQS